MINSEIRTRQRSS